MCLAGGSLQTELHTEIPKLFLRVEMGPLFKVYYGLFALIICFHLLLNARTVHCAVGANTVPKAKSANGGVYEGINTARDAANCTHLSEERENTYNFNSNH